MVPGTASAAVPGGTGHSWTGSWEAAPSGTTAGLPGAAVRNVVHLSVGGGALRVRIGNRFGVAPLRVGAVTVAVRRGSGAGAVAGSMRVVTFRGGRTVVVPAGRELLSDPVRLTVRAAADLLVTVFVPDDCGPATEHRTALQTSYVARDGAGHAGDEDDTAYTAKAVSRWYYVTGVDVRATTRGSVVALGDSLTDGTGSTPDTNHRWPDLLADRLRRHRLGVLNAGIGGNRLLRDGTAPSALARLDTDALDRAGVRFLVLFEGVNDINGTPAATDPDAYAAAYRTIVARAHARGIRVVGVTLTPYRGHPAYSAAREGVRQRVNAFIRERGVFDAVADADAALRDPADAGRLSPRYDPGDHLHFDDDGMAAVASAVGKALERWR
nr:GDSL-type esterase/lipase family protein [Streptomyces sp. SID4985]